MKHATCILLAASLLACEPVLPSDLPGLMDAMGDYDMRVSFAAARRVQRLFGKEGLFQALKHPNSYTRSKAAHFLMDFSGPDVEAALTAASSDPDKHVRMWCAWSLGESGTTAVLPALENLGQDPEDIVRSEAAEALGKFGSAIELGSVGSRGRTTRS